MGDGSPGDDSSASASAAGESDEEGDKIEDRPDDLQAALPDLHALSCVLRGVLRCTFAPAGTFCSRTCTVTSDENPDEYAIGHSVVMEGYDH